jgi:transposase InsO family protein
MELIREACQSGARKHKACELLDISARSIERWQKMEELLDGRKQSQRVPANKLTKEQRAMVLATANSGIYQNLPPSKIVPMLADEGRYIASESTFYRVLREANQLTHRLLSRPSKHSKPKEYKASKANQVWSWDITYLPTQVVGLYFYLYLVMDIYSRKIVGWSIHEMQSADHGASLIKQAHLDEGVSHELILHSDNGSPMKGLTMLAMLESLGVVPSFSRPSVSDDNPYSEALFKTLKYHPTFPLLAKFSTILDARAWCEKFTTWYNQQHLHSGLKFVTPHQRHTGEDKRILEKRRAVYSMAKIQNPERWSRNIRNWDLPTIVTLNPNRKNKTYVDSSQALLKHDEHERLSDMHDYSRQTVDAVQFG